MMMVGETLAGRIFQQERTMDVNNMNSHMDYATLPAFAVFLRFAYK